MKIYQEQKMSWFILSLWLLFGLVLFLATTRMAQGENFSPEQNAARQFQQLKAIIQL